MTNKTKQMLTLSAILLITFAVYSNAQMESLRTSVAQFETGMDVKELINGQSQEMDLPQPKTQMVTSKPEYRRGQLTGEELERIKENLIESGALKTDSPVDMEVKLIVDKSANHSIGRVSGESRWTYYNKAYVQIAITNKTDEVVQGLVVDCHIDGLPVDEKDELQVIQELKPHAVELVSMCKTYGLKNVRNHPKLMPIYGKVKVKKNGETMKVKTSENTGYWGLGSIY